MFWRTVKLKLRIFLISQKSSIFYSTVEFLKHFKSINIFIHISNIFLILMRILVFIQIFKVLKIIFLNDFYSKYKIQYLILKSVKYLLILEFELS
jgi:hypothetical protein